MSPDITFKDYYLQFIHNAEEDKQTYSDNLEVTRKVKEIAYNYIDENKECLKEDYDINLEEFKTEWIDKVYNPEETLHKKILKLLKADVDNKSRIVLLQLVKYCSLLAAEYKHIKLIRIADKRKNLKFRDYQAIVGKYYNKVHKCVLEGFGYRFGYGIGTFYIDRVTLKNSNVRKKNRIDFAATNAKKKELLEKGVKLYDDKEAIWYKERGIPYDGVDYRVFKVDDYVYQFRFDKSFVCNCRKPDYDRSEYVNAKLRGLSYKEIADTYCRTIEDIYDLPVDIRYKLNILLYKDSTKYLNFIRHVE